MAIEMSRSGSRAESSEKPAAVHVLGVEENQDGRVRGRGGRGSGGWWTKVLEGPRTGQLPDFFLRPEQKNPQLRRLWAGVAFARGGDRGCSSRRDAAEDARDSGGVQEGERPGERQRSQGGEGQPPVWKTWGRQGLLMGRAGRVSLIDVVTQHSEAGVPKCGHADSARLPRQYSSQEAGGGPAQLVEQHGTSPAGSCQNSRAAAPVTATAGSGESERQENGAVRRGQRWTEGALIGRDEVRAQVSDGSQSKGGAPARNAKPLFVHQRVSQDGKGTPEPKRPSGAGPAR